MRSEQHQAPPIGPDTFYLTMIWRDTSAMLHELREIRRLHATAQKGRTAVRLSDLMPYIWGLIALVLAAAGKWDLVGAVLLGSAH